MISVFTTKGSYPVQTKTVLSLQLLSKGIFLARVSAPNRNQYNPQIAVVLEDGEGDGREGENRVSVARKRIKDNLGAGNGSVIARGLFVVPSGAIGVR